MAAMSFVANPAWGGRPVIVMARKLACTVFVVMCRAVCGDLPFHTGDIVPVMQRTERGGKRTDWGEVAHDACPRFKRRTSVGVDVGDATDSGELNKVQLSFVNGQFATPWLMVSTHDQYLERLTCTFTTVGDHIGSVTCAPEYGTAPQAVDLVCEWSDASVVDPARALTGLMVTGLVLALTSAAVAIVNDGPLVLNVADRSPPRRAGGGKETRLEL